MLNSEFLKTRFTQYGAVWLAAFGLSAVVLILGPMVAGADLIGLTDRVLPAAFAVLGVLLLLIVSLALISRETLGTKLVFALSTVVLALPLFWAPVLGAILAAWIGERSIEYSDAYARFRIVVSDLVYPAVEAVFSGALFDTVWRTMQVFSGLVGFLSAFATAWPWIKRFLGREEAPASYGGGEGPGL
jgi:hypothetical protein